MTEREAILEALRSRQCFIPEEIMEFQLRLLQTMNTRSLIEQMRSCATILAGRVCGEPALMADDQTSYEQWSTALQEVCRAMLDGVESAIRENVGR